MAEYGITPFYGLERNLGHWLKLCRAHRDEGFLVSDWFSRTSRLAPLLAEQYILMRIAQPGLKLDAFLDAFSRDLLGRRDAAFVDGLSLLLQANWNPRYFSPRMIFNGPLLGGLMVEDPASSGWMGRRFGEFSVATLDRLLSDMRTAERTLGKVRAGGCVRPDLLEDARRLATRAVMTALRARLWYEYAWDTALPCPAPERDEPRNRLLGEYLRRGKTDLSWARRRWKTDNLDYDFPNAADRLITSQEAIVRLFPYCRPAAV
jgi:hypothetical protein